MLPCNTLPRTAPVVASAQEKERGEPCAPTGHIRVRKVCRVAGCVHGAEWRVGVALVVGGR